MLKIEVQNRNQLSSWAIKYHDPNNNDVGAWRGTLWYTIMMYPDYDDLMIMTIMIVMIIMIIITTKVNYEKETNNLPD